MAAILKSNEKDFRGGAVEGGRGGEDRGENAYFFPPLPSPSPVLNPSTSPSKTLFDSSQLSGSVNVQDGGTNVIPENNSLIRPKIRLLCRLRNYCISN